MSSWVNDFWSQDKATIAKCKNLLFSGVLMLNKDRNIYTPVKSPVYCLAKGEVDLLEGDDNDQLHPILTEILRWRTIIGPEYQQYVLNTFRHSLVQAV